MPLMPTAGAGSCCRSPTVQRLRFTPEPPSFPLEGTIETSKIDPHQLQESLIFGLRAGLPAILICAASCVLASACVEPRCNSWGDCAGVKYSDPERCFPAESICERSVCTRTCRPQCETVLADFNACEEPLICSSSPNTPIGGCTALPISCSSVDDCPSYLPPTGSGDGSGWACIDGSCRYPGYQYAVERE
jgi:hypothetical protein